MQAMLAATPFSSTVKISKLDLAASGFVDPSTGIQGVADLDGTINFNGGTVESVGNLTAQKLKLAEKGSPAGRPLQVKYFIDYIPSKESGIVKEGNISAGRAHAQMPGTFQSQGTTTAINMKLDGDGMPVDDVEAVLPAIGLVLPPNSKLQGGTLSMELAMVGTMDKLVISGPIRLSNSKLAGFDLGSKMSAISALSGKNTGGKDTTIQNLSATVRIAPEGTQANNINLTMPALGVVTGAGTVSPSGALNFKMNANVSGGAAGGDYADGRPRQSGRQRSFHDRRHDLRPEIRPGRERHGGQRGAAGDIGQAPWRRTGNNPANALGGLFGKKKK